VPIVTMKQLLEAGVHFGHRSRRWNPKMRPFIFTERNGIHSLDLQQSIRVLHRAYDMVRDIAAEGGTVVFVGTKRQAQENVKTQAMRCGMPFVTNRWLGGTLTNFTTIRSRIEYMLELEQQREDGSWTRLPKKEVTLKQRELAKLQRRLGGLRNLNQLPDAIFVTDCMTEDIAIKEANRLDIPVIAMVDTNCDPEPIDVVIPANDDAIRAILLITTKIADGIVEGQQMRGVMMDDEMDEDDGYDLVDGPRTFEPDMPAAQPVVAETVTDDEEAEDEAEDIIVIDEDEDEDYED